MFNKYLKFVEGQFANCFSNKGYIKENPISITSQVDPSVTFIGSAISPMKKYVLSGTIGNSGRYLLQNSIRTRGIKSVKNYEYSMFGSYFNCMGALVEYSYLHKLVYDVFEYLTDYLQFHLKDIRIRIKSTDTDLINSVKDIDSNIVREYDTFGEKYYQHRYGLEDEGIRGRNFNIGIRKKNTDLFLDIGNIIVMENNDNKLAVEVGLGNQTISMSYFGVESSIASSRMADIMEIDSVGKMKFADAIIVVAILLSENIKEIKYPRWFRYYFRKYCEAIEFWQEVFGIQSGVIAQYIRNFVKIECNVDLALTNDEIVQYIQITR